MPTDWKSVDFTINNAGLAELLGCRIETVSRARSQYAPKTNAAVGRGRKGSKHTPTGRAVGDARSQAAILARQLLTELVTPQLNPQTCHALRDCLAELAPPPGAA